MVDGSQQGFFCFVRGKKNSLPSGVGGKNSSAAACRKKKKKKKEIKQKYKAMSDPLHLGLWPSGVYKSITHNKENHTHTK